MVSKLNACVYLKIFLIIILLVIVLKKKKIDYYQETDRVGVHKRKFVCEDVVWLDDVMTQLGCICIPRAMPFLFATLLILTIKF